MNNWVRDALEVAMLIGVGGMGWAAVNRLRHGQITVVRCAVCERPTSRAYPMCKHCGAPRPDNS